MIPVFVSYAEQAADIGREYETSATGSAVDYAYRRALRTALRTTTTYGALNRVLVQGFNASMGRGI
jgi:hypothetical protein